MEHLWELKKAQLAKGSEGQTYFTTIFSFLQEL